MPTRQADVSGARFHSFDSLSVFAVFYGLDWIATVPPTLRLTNEAFGDTAAPMVFGWVVAGHQIGAATAALVAGNLRTLQGNYIEAFSIAGASGVVAAVLALSVGRRPQLQAPAASSSQPRARCAAQLRSA